jgi:polyisoprenoid-binding protein YceI
VKGDFKIHGVSREVEIEGTLQKKPDGILLKANWVLLLEDYDIIPPKLLFVKVDQEQKIEIEALLKPTDN